MSNRRIQSSFRVGFVVTALVVGYGSASPDVAAGPSTAKKPATTGTSGRPSGVVSAMPKGPGSVSPTVSPTVSPSAATSVAPPPSVAVPAVVAPDGASSSETAKATVVEMGTPSVIGVGGLPKNIAITLGKLQPLLDACYRTASSVGDEQAGEGSLVMRLELVGPGTVAAATILSSVEVPSGLRGCVRDTFAGVVVGGVGPEPVEVTLPLRFSRELEDTYVRPISACATSCAGAEVDDDIRAALRERAKRAAACLRNPAAPGEPVILKSGTIEVDVRYAPNGSLCGVTTAGDPFARASIRTCIAQAFGAPLGVSPGGSCLDVRVPLVLKGT